MHLHPQSSFSHLEDEVFPCPLRLAYFQIPSKYNHLTPGFDLASGLEISCLLWTLAYVFHTHQHMIRLSVSQPFGTFNPRFFWFWRLLVYKLTDIKFPCLGYSVQRK